MRLGEEAPDRSRASLKMEFAFYFQIVGFENKHEMPVHEMRMKKYRFVELRSMVVYECNLRKPIKNSVSLFRLVRRCYG